MSQRTRTTMNDSKPDWPRVIRLLATCVVICAVVAVPVAAGPGAPDPAPRPFVTAPQPHGGDTIAPARAPDYIPRARGADVRRRGEAATQRPLHMRPVRDLPPLAVESESLRPRPVFAPSAPAMRVARPDRDSAAAMWRRTGPDGGHATVSTDATLAQSARAALVGVPRLRQNPVPFLRLAIPDPFALVQAVALAPPPPDADLPAPPAPPPPAPKLPVATKQK